MQRSCSPEASGLNALGADTSVCWWKCWKGAGFHCFLSFCFVKVFIFNFFNLLLIMLKSINIWNLLKNMKRDISTSGKEVWSIILAKLRFSWLPDSGKKKARHFGWCVPSQGQGSFSGKGMKILTDFLASGAEKCCQWIIRETPNETERSQEV